MDDISAGLAGSDSGILISNLDYLASAPCMDLEARHLLSRKPQIPILHIPEPETPNAEIALTAVASHPGVEPRACDSFDGVVAELARFFSQEICVHRETNAGESREIVWPINDHRFQLDARGWDISSERISVQRGDTAGPQLWRHIGKVRLGINVTVGKHGSNRAQIESTWTDETAESRWKYYEYAIGKAQWFVTGRSPRLVRRLREQKSRLRDRLPWHAKSMAMRTVLRSLGIHGAGIHLYHHLGSDHFATTYHMRFLGWFRTYSILVPDRSGGSDFEFVFTANCKGTFKEFCRYANLFDEFVLSLQYADT